MKIIVKAHNHRNLSRVHIWVLSFFAIIRFLSPIVLNFSFPIAQQTARAGGWCIEMVQVRSRVKSKVFFFFSFLQLCRLEKVVFDMRFLL